MQQTNIQELANKFWRGESTDAEERELRKLLLETDSVSPQLSALKSYFAFTATVKSSELDEAFDQELQGKLLPKRQYRPIRRMMGIAAALTVLLASVYFFKRSSQMEQIAHKSEFIDTYADSEEAYAEVKKALMMVSNSMNSGLAHTQVLGKFNEAQQELIGN